MGPKCVDFGEWHCFLGMNRIPTKKFALTSCSLELICPFVTRRHGTTKTSAKGLFFGKKLPIISTVRGRNQHDHNHDHHFSYLCFHPDWSEKVQNCAKCTKGISQIELHRISSPKIWLMNFCKWRNCGNLAAAKYPEIFSNNRVVFCWFLKVISLCWFLFINDQGKPIQFEPHHTEMSFRNQ